MQSPGWLWGNGGFWQEVPNLNVKAPSLACPVLVLATSPLAWFLAAPDFWCLKRKGLECTGRHASRPEWATGRSPQSLVQKPCPPSWQKGRQEPTHLLSPTICPSWLAMLGPI